LRTWLDSDLVVGALLLGVCGLAAWLELYARRKARAQLHRWAEEHGFTILKQREAWWFASPFFWKAGRGQRAFRITVLDPEGRPRSGWVLCGGWLGGLVLEPVEVRWDKRRGP
jgi:hypothetical protein